MVTVKKKGDMEKMNITHFTNEILRRGGEITNEGHIIGVLLNNSRFTLLTNEDGIIGVGGYFFYEYDIRECGTLRDVLSMILGYA